MDVCHRPFLPGTSLEPAVIPTVQASSFTLQYFPYYVCCSKYSCLCSESIECFPGTVSKFFLKLLVTIPVAPIITGTIVHSRFHIRCISIHKLLYFSFFSASFCTVFLSAGIATSISVRVFSFLFLSIISGLFAVTSLSVCTAWFHNSVTSPSSYTGLGMCVCVCTICLWFQYLRLCILLLLLLLLLSSSSSSSPLCRVFILIFLRQTMSLGNSVLQLFCCYYSWCLYR